MPLLARVAFGAFLSYISVCWNPIPFSRCISNGTSFLDDSPKLLPLLHLFVHQWNLWAFRVLRMFLLRCFFCCCLFLFCFCLKPLLGCKFFGQKDLTYLIHLCITHSTDIYWAHYVPACNLMPAYHRSSINIKPNWNVVGDLTPKSSKAFQSGVTFRESLSSALKSLAGFYSWKNWTMISGFSFLLGTYITLLLGREFPFPFPQLQARRVA